MRNTYPPAPNAVLLLYSIASSDSLAAAKDRVTRYIRAQNPPILTIIATKCDLKEQRQVSEETGRQFAASVGASWMECSSKDNINVHEVFVSTFREFAARRGISTTRRAASWCALV